MHEKHIAVDDGCRIFTRVEGPTDAPVVVLAHALGSDLDMWAPQVEVFTARYRVLRYDARGHGRSDAPPGAYTIERLSRDVVAVLEAHDIQRAHFIGLSLGGMVGQWLGAHMPAHVQRLVLASTSAFMGPAQGWQDRIAVVQQHGPEPLADGTLGRWFTEGFRARAPDVVAKVRATIVATSRDGYAGCCAAIRDMDLRDSAAHIRAPTLLIAGTHDPGTPPSASADIARRMKVPTDVVTVDAAHLANIEAAALWNEHVLAFLRRG